MKLYGIVRDANGRPKIDNPNTVPPQMAAMLTEEERQQFGIPRPPQDLIDQVKAKGAN